MIAGWNNFLESIKNESFYIEMMAYLAKAYENNRIFPKKENVFKAFELVKPEDVKVIIIGQDPYHEVNQAMGLSFSVPEGEPLPPSLKNIYKEIELETKMMMDYRSGDLTYLANQGVLLLNAYLTVEEGKPLSHQFDFYIKFLEAVIKYLETEDKGHLSLLWGNFAKKFEKEIIGTNSFIIKSNHPSPLSANRGGFFNTNQFKRANEYLSSIGKQPINWCNNNIYN